jgi:hypothetical protein
MTGVKPLIAMLGILAALAVMLGIYILAYRYYRKSHPPKQPGDRGPG